MRTTPTRGIKLFTIAGITVYLHWSWFLVAAFEIQRQSDYHSIIWNVAEYLTLFVIVLMHEFGHALACRSVGGSADRIMLWPLGGVAYVRPPMRPGAWLWSIVAGPLVNVALIPVFYFLMHAFSTGGANPDLDVLLWHLWWINTALLIFNMLPIYPLDGGKILQSLLWFVVGQVRSLMIASVLGIICAVGIVGALLVRSGGQPNIWLIVMAVFAISQSVAGFKYARSLAKVMALPRHEGFRCPDCKQCPPVGLMWRSSCGTASELFNVKGVCPTCNERLANVRCPLCGISSGFDDWRNTNALRSPYAPPVPT